MIDFNYINSLPELPDKITSGGTYKVTTSSVTGFNPASNVLELYVLHGATLNIAKEAVFGEKTKLYVMGKVHIDGSVTFKKGSRIVMGENGQFIATSKSEIIADQCSFEAPITQVFDDNITATGIWDIPVAYPQWFTGELPLTGDSNKTTTTDTTDWSVFINKAIKMKGTGEVFIPKGVYDVSSPIYLIPGVQLRGACGVNWDTLGKSGKGSTVIRAKVEGSAKNPYNDFIVYVNVKKNSDGTYTVDNTSLFTTGTVIENILFKVATFSYPKCIVAGCPCHFNNLCFRNFRQSIKYVNSYCDGRRITNCNIGADFTEQAEDNPSDGEIYQIDLYNNGDGCIIEGTSIGSNFYKALKIGNSCGTIVTGNIINAPVHIRFCKGIVFSCNHMEASARLNPQTNTHLEISNSAVTLEGNYFEKSDTTSVIVKDGEYGDTSVVTLTGNQFVYIAGSIYHDETLEDRITRINNISEYDIQIGSRSVISLVSNFRYAAISNSGVTSSFPFGINISKNVDGKISAFEEFNNLSFKLSQECFITGLKIVSKSLSLTESGDYLSTVLPVNNGLQFLAGSSETATTYEYKYCIFPDGVRPSSETYKAVSVYKTPTTKKGGNAIMMSVSFASSGGRACVKISRSHTENNIKKTMYVVVPVCGARYIYDNGISIAGYKWVSE